MVHRRNMRSSRIRYERRRGFDCDATANVMRTPPRGSPNINPRTYSGGDYSSLNSRQWKLTRGYPVPITRPLNLCHSCDAVSDTQRQSRSTIVRYNLERRPEPIYNLNRVLRRRSRSVSPPIRLPPPIRIPQSSTSSFTNTIYDAVLPPLDADLPPQIPIDSGDRKHEEKEDCLSDTSSSRDTFTGLYPFLNYEEWLENPNFGNILEELSDSHLTPRTRFSFSYSPTRWVPPSPTRWPSSHSRPRQMRFIEYKEAESSGPSSPSLSIEFLLPLHNVGVKGAKWHNINQLPTRRYQVRVTAEESNMQKSCRVCMEDFKNEELLRTLPCLHFFHKECIDKWLFQNRTCPVCKFDIMQKQNYNNF